jgi:hypothetical protein
MAKSLFPEDMISKGNGGGMTLESIASKLTMFHEQLHLVHWQTTSYAEHQAVGSLYDYVQGFKDGVIEKLMGYTGKRPTSIALQPITTIPAQSIIAEMMSFASSLKSYAESNGYHDIANLADEFSGETAKTKYLLTLS